MIQHQELQNNIKVQMKDQDISQWQVYLILDNKNTITMKVYFTEEFPNEHPTIHIDVSTQVQNL